MTTFRIRAEFDLEIVDEALSREMARQFLIERVDHATLNGDQIQTGTTTPGEAIDGVLDNPKAVSSLVATSLVTRAAAGMAAIRCSNLNIEHIEP